MRKMYLTIKLLINPNLIKVKINKEDILKYYFFTYIILEIGFLMITKMQKNVKSQYDDDLYSYWINNELMKKHEEILSIIEKFMTHRIIE